MSLWTKIDAYRRLGILNLARVFVYLLKLKSGSLRKQLPTKGPVQGPFFGKFSPDQRDQLNPHYADWSLVEETDLFGWYKLPLRSKPDWHRSVLTDKPLQGHERHWSEISDFSTGVGDIKGIWEPSRFTWVIPMLQNYVKSGDEDWLNECNEWVENWSASNPANQGANWKCAQETSFRVIHLAAGAMILHQLRPNAAMVELIEQHVHRILPTLDYAMAQDNNHGTSEAAALYIGATWLLQSDPDNNLWQKWRKHGQDYLGNRVFRLIMDDGSFSQYSVTYHRLMLDTTCMVELWRKFIDAPAFPKAYVNRVASAASWLFEVTDTDSGDAPNIGANDGAHILNFFNAEYRDFRYSVELACQLFHLKRAYDDSIADTISLRFDLSTAGKMLKHPSMKMAHGGYGVIREHSAWCCMRVPTFQFRPGQADALHLDFWLAGKNILRDGGSYSYNTDPQWLSYFSGVASHNVVEVDGKEQMPKVSRFLFGKWPQFEKFDVASSPHSAKMHGSYTNWRGVLHAREVQLHERTLEITDHIEGVEEQACLRWRLADLDWAVKNHSLVGENIVIEVHSDAPITGFTLAEGFESRYYGKKRAIPVLEISVSKNTKITTIIRWK